MFNPVAPVAWTALLALAAALLPAGVDAHGYIVVNAQTQLQTPVQTSHDRRLSVLSFPWQTYHDASCFWQ